MLLLSFTIYCDSLTMTIPDPPLPPELFCIPAPPPPDPVLAVPASPFLLCERPPLPPPPAGGFGKELPGVPPFPPPAKYLTPGVGPSVP